MSWPSDRSARPVASPPSEPPTYPFFHKRSRFGLDGLGIYFVCVLIYGECVVLTITKCNFFFLLLASRPSSWCSPELATIVLKGNFVFVGLSEIRTIK